MPVRKLNLKTALGAFLILALFATASFAEEGYVPGELIIKLKDDSNLTAPRSGRWLDRTSVKRTFSELDMVVVKVEPGESLDDVQASLESNPDVEYVEKNYYVWADATPNDPRYGQQWYMNTIDAPQAWDVTKGNSNVVIAVLDTGVESSHEDISGKLLPGCNVTGNFTESSCGTNTEDGHGHGTGVAGTAAAKTNNNLGAAGICWNCSILPVKVLGDGGGGTLEDTIQGILFARNYAVSNPSKRVIINMSLGRECNTSGVTQSEQNAINLAWSSGLLIVASAGNSGNNLLQCPASGNNVIAVSATTNNDAKAGFSSYGSFVDLAAPGVSIVNAIGTSNVAGSFYTSWSGTSFSAPVVSGVAGLVWSADTSLTNAEVEQILKDTAENIGPSNYFGEGRVNADFAVDLASSGSPAPPTPVPSPAPSPTSPPAPVGSPVLSALNPGTAGALNSISVTAAPPGARVSFYYSSRTGNTSITSGACRGKSLDLYGAASFGTAVADTAGNAKLNVNLSSSSGGQTIYLQAFVDKSNACQITKRVSQSIKRASGGGSSTPPGRPAPIRRPVSRF